MNALSSLAAFVWSSPFWRSRMRRTAKAIATARLASSPNTGAMRSISAWASPDSRYSLMSLPPRYLSRSSSTA